MSGADNMAGLPSAFAGLSGLAKRLQALDAELSELAEAPDRNIAGQARKLRRDIRDFEPSVTMIGQVKAGKTTLVNAMVGWPDLLPADVNPWTSVVTSLHLQPRMAEEARRSSFRFFSNEEWDHLIRQGGRVGEIASRAGAEEELTKVRRQLDEMRAKSQARLGKRFQMLLGQSHEYDCFDADLIQRYVCLGDDFWEEGEAPSDQGRFADITKAADLWFARPDLPVNLCIQDTPGVNDTFMIREQITINALRGSRLCVVVLSAQQALSSVDLGLIRLISNVKSREIIIFVNRIDELGDPVREVPEIRASIAKTLKSFDGPTQAQVIFGSGHWAGHAVGNTCEELVGDSGRALVSWAEAQLADAPADISALQAIWQISGLPELGQAISERITQGAGQKLIDRVEAALQNLRTSMVAYEAAAALEPEAREAMSRDDIAAAFDRLERTAMGNLEAKLQQVLNAFEARSESARQTFLTRATGSLIRHLEAYGDQELWTYDAAGLRILLRSAYQVFARASAKSGKEIYQDTASEITALYAASYDFGVAPVLIQAPPLPTAPPPVALGQTIALDLRGSWWTRFWRRQRGYDAFAADFSKLIHEETVPIVETLHRQHAQAHVYDLRATLQGFITEQREVLVGLADRPPQTEFGRTG